MHDLDRVRLEATDPEYLEEAELDEFATQLLELTDEAELDQFLGRLISGAASAARQFARSNTGQALKGIAKDAARQALPVIGRGIGGLFSSQAARGGETIGRGLGQAFGLELEGLSPPDQQFEAARAYVRWVRAASRGAEQLEQTLPPPVAARRAAVVAARRHVPALAAVVGRPRLGATKGRWERRGRSIVLFNT